MEDRPWWDGETLIFGMEDDIWWVGEHEFLDLELVVCGDLETLIFGVEDKNGPKKSAKRLINLRLLSGEAMETVSKNFSDKYNN